MNENKTLHYIHDKYITEQYSTIENDYLLRSSIIHTIHKNNIEKIYNILTNNKKFVKKYVSKLEQEKKLQKQMRIYNSSSNIEYNEFEEDYELNNEINDENIKKKIANITYTVENPNLVKTRIVSNKLFTNSEEWADIFKYLFNKLKNNYYNIFVNAVYRTLSCYITASEPDYVRKLNGFINNYNKNYESIEHISEAKFKQKLLTIIVGHSDECYKLVNYEDVVDFIENT